MTACERCKADANVDSFNLYDFCAMCSKNLCDDCMEEGCCENTPAISGLGAEEAATDAYEGA